MDDASFSPPPEFAEDFRTFAAEEARGPLPQAAVLFYGSSTIRLWTSLARDFPELPVVNRGFGGSTLAECVRAMSRCVFPILPRAIVLYAGDNDLDHGASPEEVQELFEDFVSAIDDRLGLLPIVFVAIKPSPARWWNLAKIRRTNALISETIATWPQAHFLDLFPHMLRADGQPRRELYEPDGLHLNVGGYRVWTQYVRASLAALGLLP